MIILFIEALILTYFFQKHFGFSKYYKKLWLKRPKKNAFKILINR